MAKAPAQYKASMQVMIGTNKQIVCLIEANSTDPEGLYEEVVRIVARLEEKYPDAMFRPPPDVIAAISDPTDDG